MVSDCYAESNLIMRDPCPCKVAFVGAGFMASEHLKAFKDVPGVELSGIFSRTPGRAEKLAQTFGVLTVCSSIAELYEKTGAYLVVIAVPELSVRTVCIEAFEFPWACLVEKPAGYNLPDAQSILESAEILKRRAYVAMNRRHYSSTRGVVDDLKNSVGQRLIHVFDQEDPAAARRAGRPEEVVKNWMYANAIHVIDYFRVLGRGEITSVEPIVRWQPDRPGFVVAKLGFSSGDIGIYEAVWNGPGPWAVTVTTQEKRWEMRPLEKSSVQVYGSRKADVMPTHPWDNDFKAGLRLQAEEAVKAVQLQPTMLPTLNEAFETMKLVGAIYEP